MKNTFKNIDASESKSLDTGSRRGLQNDFVNENSSQTRIKWRKSKIGGDSGERRPSSQAKTSQNESLKEWPVPVTAVNKEVKKL